MEKPELEVYGLTDRGPTRAQNEDHYLVAALDRSLRLIDTSLDARAQARLGGGCDGHLLMVADGVGGGPAGGLASEIAVETATDYIACTMPWFLGLAPGDGEGAAEELAKALERSHRAVTQRGPARMATTMTLAYLLWPRLFVVHAGDSRCYLLRRGRLRCLTRDHTLAEDMARKGSPMAGVVLGKRVGRLITKAIGGRGQEESLRPDVDEVQLAGQDTLLLCSDGLHGPVEDEGIREILMRSTSAKAAAHALVEAALEAGGQDNVTVVVARVLGADEEATVELLRGSP